MLKGLYTAYTGMLNEQHRMDTLTNNLANVDTVGFKKEGSTSETFKQVLAYKIKDTSEAPNVAKRMGMVAPGVKIGENYTDYTEGALKATGNTWDLAITGTGFFAIGSQNSQGEDVVRYTRAGSFVVDSEGVVKTEDGEYLLDNRGRQIRIKNRVDAVTIGDDGTIYQAGTAVGTVGITDFENYDYLSHYGETMFEPVEGARTIPTDAKVRSGFLENSNVNVVSEMVNMIAVQRQYDSNQKIITSYDESLDIAVNQLGRIG